MYLLAGWLCAGLIISCSTPGPTESHHSAQRLGSRINPEKTRIAQIDLMIGVLTNPQVDRVRKQQAARALVELNDPHANTLLVNQLNNDGDPVTQRLIMTGLSLSTLPPSPLFTEPLLKLLERADEPRHLAAATALGRYKDAGITAHLIAIAQNPVAKIGFRCGAIMTLGYHQEQHVAAILISLLDETQPTPIRKTAREALSRLTGIGDYNDAQWRGWWSQHKSLSNIQWHRAVHQSLVDQNARLAIKKQHLQDRFIDLQRQLYRAIPKDDRPKMLIQMLEDPLLPTRLLAIDLCIQRLIDNQPIDGPLRQALIARLDDPSPIHRRRAALLLRDLADHSAADVMAMQLASGHETDTQVIGAYLVMMAKLPRAEVVPNALRWLADPALRNGAAGMLAAAADKGMLTPPQTNQAAKQARLWLQDDDAPEAKMIELLGRVGDDKDWQRIAAWIGSDNDAIKRTAAQMWADSHRPLAILLRHAGDPVIQQLVIAAARRRGSRPETLETLIAYKPETDQVVEAWRSAVVAVAGRVPGTVALEAQRRLAEQGEPLEFQEQALSAAIARLSPNLESHLVIDWNPPPTEHQDHATRGAQTQLNTKVLVDLLLTRAEVRLLNGDPVQARTDYMNLDPPSRSMSDNKQLSRYQLGMLRVMLASGEIEEAFEWVNRFASISPRIDLKIKNQAIELFLVSAQRSVLGERTEHAKSVLSRLRLWLGTPLPEHLEKRIAELEQSLETDSAPAPSPGTDPPKSPKPSDGSPPKNDTDIIPQSTPEAPQK